MWCPEGSDSLKAQTNTFMNFSSATTNIYDSLSLRWPEMRVLPMAILSRKWERQLLQLQTLTRSGSSGPTATCGFFHSGCAKQAWLVRISITLAGNVHPNPGLSTIRWLCPMCGQSAHYRSIQCVNRRRWYHIKCTNVINVTRLEAMEVRGMQRVNWTRADCIAAPATSSSSSSTTVGSTPVGV